MNDDKIILKNKIDEIAQTLLEEIVVTDAYAASGQCPVLIGLYTGLPGRLLFLQLWQKLTPGARLSDSVERCIDRLVVKMENGCDILNYCNGAAGVIHYMRLLEGVSPGRVPLERIESMYRERLSAKALEQTAAGNFDYFHGGLGICNLYVDDERYATAVLDALERTGERTERGMRWRSKLAGKDRTGYNICFSHGISNIEVYLGRLVCGNPSREVRSRAREMLGQTVKYIMAQEMDFDRYGSFFPPTSLDNEGFRIGRSRMAYCYGDPGVLAGLWQGAKILGDGALCEKLHGMMLCERPRREEWNTLISEAAICHGSAGLAMLFNYYAEQTGDPAFRETVDFWIGKTLAYASHKDGLAGFKSRNHDAQRGYFWENNGSLLEGVAGIGTVLMLALHDDKTLRKNLYNTFNLY